MHVHSRMHDRTIYASASSPLAYVESGQLSWSVRKREGRGGGGGAREGDLEKWVKKRKKAIPFAIKSGCWQVYDKHQLIPNSFCFFFLFQGNIRQNRKWRHSERRAFLFDKILLIVKPDSNGRLLFRGVINVSRGDVVERKQKLTHHVSCLFYYFHMSSSVLFPHQKLKNVMKKWKRPTPISKTQEPEGMTILLSVFSTLTVSLFGLSGVGAGADR